MVQYDVHDHCDSLLVTGIDEILDCSFSAIKLVQGKEKIGIVSPTQVAFKFGEWHELDGIYTQSFQVAQRIFQCLKISCGYKIPDQQFIDDKVPFVWSVEVLHLPGIGRFCRLQDTDNTGCFSSGIGLEIRESRGGNIAVIVGVKHFFCIVICHPQGPVNQVLIRIFIAWN